MRRDVAGARIARATAWLRDAETLLDRSAADFVADRGAVDRATAGALRGAAGLRNRIAHGYAMVDYAPVQRESKEGLPALRAFLETVARAAGL